MHKLFVLIALALLTACAPIPHIAKVAPEIRGTIYINGIPAVGAQVRQCIEYQNSNCNSDVSIYTDENGNFILKQRREFRWYVTLFGDEIFKYGFSVIFNGVIYPGCSGLDIGALADITYVNYDLTDKETCYLNLGQ